MKTPLEVSTSILLVLGRDSVLGTLPIASLSYFYGLIMCAFIVLLRRLLQGHLLVQIALSDC